MLRSKEDSSPALFRETCRRNRLKITPQREAIYRELGRLKSHPSAVGVYRIVRKEFPSISFDTVHRTLLTFSEIGLVDVVEGYGNPRRFDPNLEQHHHLHCIRCGAVVDFYHRGYDNLEIPPAVSREFTVLGKKVVLKGYCRGCGSKKRTR